jgi:hypothetical protein
MEIGTTHADGGHMDLDFTGAGIGNETLGDVELAHTS